MKTINDFLAKKQNQEKITMVTCYDYTSACLIDQTDVDCILVGDSVAMVMHGFSNTIFADLEMMRSHTAAVARGIKNKFIIADMPFLSYRKSAAETMDAVQILMQAGAQAIKLEGADGNLEIIHHIVTSGVPVMGHLGLTPQSIHTIGGYKIQGKNEAAQNKLMTDAKLLQQAGCFALVLECVPTHLAQSISQALSIPTIGIGAGPETDGQVLVFHDLLGLQPNFNPKFLKKYLNGAEVLNASINNYVSEVKNKKYPAPEHSF